MKGYLKSTKKMLKKVEKEKKEASHDPHYTYLKFSKDLEEIAPTDTLYILSIGLQRIIGKYDPKDSMLTGEAQFLDLLEDIERWVNLLKQFFEKAHEMIDNTMQTYRDPTAPRIKFPEDKSWLVEEPELKAYIGSYTRIQGALGRNPPDWRYLEGSSSK